MAVGLVIDGLVLVCFTVTLMGLCTGPVVFEDLVINRRRATTTKRYWQLLAAGAGMSWAAQIAVFGLQHLLR